VAAKWGHGPIAAPGLEFKAVTAPAWLIAEREFRAYTTTASFWVALLVGPLVMVGARALTAAAGRPPAPIAVAVEAPDPVLARSATAALTETAALEGRRVVPTRAPGPDRLVLARRRGALEADFSAGFPLSASGRALVGRQIERDEALRALAAIGADPRATPVRVRMAPDPSAADTGAPSRFCLVMILWLTLTGSLGMLLQAVVRERANRALEGLLAAARPWEIVLGKLGGVGAVSALVLFAWLGCAAAIAAAAHDSRGLIQLAIGGLAAPATLVRAVAIYILAFGFYGLVTVAVGASARDSAAAQNLSRPMFAVLLAAFFAAFIGVSSAADRLDWLLYVPPFTPFMLLLRAPEALPLASQLIALGLLAASTALAAGVAVGALTLTGERPPPPWRRTPAAKTVSL
jgi:ABC-2 type transport system permease protein